MGSSRSHRIRPPPEGGDIYGNPTPSGQVRFEAGPDCSAVRCAAKSVRAAAFRSRLLQAAPFADVDGKHTGEQAVQPNAMSAGRS